MMGLKLYTDILENNIRVMAAMLICLFICGLMRIKSAKLKLLLMSLVWVRILIPLSIRFNIKIVSTDILSEVSYTDSETGITINMYEILAVIWLLGIVVIFLHNMLADMKFRNGLSTSIPQEILAGGKRVKVYRSDFISSGLHCTGKIFENNCCHFTVFLSGYLVGRLSVKWGKMLHCTAGRKRNIHADSDAVLCSHIWSNFV